MRGVNSCAPFFTTNPLNAMADNLARMESATVRLINLNGTPVIHKQNASLVELSFYKYVAPGLSDKGLGLPHALELNIASRDLFLEYIPFPVTQNQLRDNVAFIKMLAVVHTYPLTPPSPLHQHGWSDKASEITQQQLNLSAEARSALQKIKSASDTFFARTVWFPGTVTLEIGPGDPAEISFCLTGSVSVQVRRQLTLHL